MSKVIICKRSNKEIYVDDNKCYKVFKEGYSIADILNEALNHVRVEETDLNIPHLYGAFQIENKLAIVMENIDGKTLATLMQDNSDKLDEYLNSLSICD